MFFLISEVEIVAFLGVKLKMCLMRSAVMFFFLLSLNSVAVLKVFQKVTQFPS